jgi:hypothetical protein
MREQMAEQIQGFERCPNHSRQRACVRDNGHDGPCFFDVVMPRSPAPATPPSVETITRYDWVPHGYYQHLSPEQADEGEWVKYEDVAALALELARVKQEIEAAWRDIKAGYDIEDRAYFEREAPRNGFGYPLVQALHHIWKRNPDVVAITKRAEAAESRLASLTTGLDALSERLTSEIWRRRMISGDVNTMVLRTLQPFLDELDALRTTQGEGR